MPQPPSQQHGEDETVVIDNGARVVGQTQQFGAYQQNCNFGVAGDNESTESGCPAATSSDGVWSYKLDMDQLSAHRLSHGYIDGSLNAFRNALQAEIDAQLALLQQTLLHDNGQYNVKHQNVAIWRTTPSASTNSQTFTSRPGIDPAHPIIEACFTRKFSTRGDFGSSEVVVPCTCSHLETTAEVSHSAIDDVEAIQSGMGSESQENHAPSELENDFEIQITRRTEALAPPVAHTYVQEIVQGNKFDLVSMILVLTNMIFMVVESEVKGRQLHDQLYGKKGVQWHNVEACFDAFQHTFNAWFVVEIGLKFYAYGKRFFKSSLNILDVVVVVTSCFDSYGTMMVGQSSWLNFSFLRLVRCLELVRIAEAFEKSSVFSELRVMIRTVASAARSTMWSAVLLGTIILCSGMLMSQLVHDVVNDENHEFDDEFRKWLFSRYGSTGRASWTMFMVTLSGGWPNYALPLVEHVTPWFVVFWVLYVLAVVFAVLRALAALFIRATLKAASADEDMMIMEKLKEKEEFSNKLRHFFLEGDVSGDGKLDRPEFETMISTDRVAAWLQILELEKHEITVLFNMLCDGTARVAVDELIDGALRLKGNARAIDAILIMREQNKIKLAVQSMAEQLGIQN